MTSAEYNSCVDAHADGAYRFILHNIKDPETARDVVQDAFEKLWVNHEDVNYAKAKSYLFTVAYRIMIDKIRKDKKVDRFNAAEMDILADNTEYLGLKKTLQEGLGRLPEIQRTVIMLRDYEGYSYQEIGSMTDLTESQVKVYIYRARVFLKKYIGKIENVI